MPHLFNTVQEFLQSDQQWGQVEPPELGGFRGEVRKSATEIGQLRELTEDDLKQGIKTDTLVIATLNNPKRPRNIYKMEIPPKRTGKFAAFMDEAEQSATSSGYRYVRAYNIDNEFLPQKLEARGYRRVSRDDWNPNPDCMKDLRRAP